MTTQIDYQQHKSEQAEVSMNTANDQERKALAADVEAFLAGGGEIEVLPYGITKEERKMTELENREHMRNTAFKKGKDSLGRKKSGAHAHNERTWQASKDRGLV